MIPLRIILKIALFSDIGAIFFLKSSSIRIHTSTKQRWFLERHKIFIASFTSESVSCEISVARLDPN